MGGVVGLCMVGVWLVYGVWGMGCGACWECGVELGVRVMIGVFGVGCVG